MPRMSTGSKRSLPLLVALHGPGGVADGGEPLHLERARKRLGGAATSGVGCGRIVEVTGAGSVPVLGVVLHQTDADIDVWVGEALVRRTRHEKVTAVDASAREVSDATLRAASDARVFGSIERGARVLYDAGEGRVAEGLLVEKCRYGGLVARDDGGVMAVGFRRLWPAEGRS